MAWEPLRELRAWQERLERLSTHHADAWAPPIDVYETEDRYVIAAEVPGLARDQIELAFEASRLIIRGTRIDRPVDAEAVIHFHQVERGHGQFSRTFEFAAKIDLDAVSADLANGVLTVNLPKVAAEPLRKIEVL